MDPSGQRESGNFSGEKKTAAVSVPSEIAQNLKVADEDAAFKYDESARNIVAQKSVLAYILTSHRGMARFILTFVSRRYFRLMASWLKFY